MVRFSADLIASALKSVLKSMTVKGDLHDIGKNLVVLMLEGVGFEVVDLGADVSPEAFVGGAPLTQEYADRIAADGYASDAPGAVALCKRLLG